MSVVIILLERGADIHFKEHGVSLVDVANASGNLEIASLIMNRLGASL